MAYDFNGSNQYLSTASAPASGSPSTIAAWVRIEATNIDHVIGYLGEASGTHRNQVQLSAVNSAGGPSFAVILFIGSSVGAAQRATTSTATSVNTWHHAAGVFSSSTSRTAYIDGVAGTENTTDIGSQNTATAINIGVRTANNGQAAYFDGQIAEFGIWNAALTDAEIASLAKGMTCDKVRPQSLVFYSPLTRDLIDYKGGLAITNNNTATVANHPRVYA
jgi:hypothetical protein